MIKDCEDDKEFMKINSITHEDDKKSMRMIKIKSIKNEVNKVNKENKVNKK